MKNSLIFLILLLFGCSAIPPQNFEGKTVFNQEKRVMLGVENFLQNHLSLVRGKRVGLVTHPGGVNRQLKSTADLLFENPRVHLTALYAPEHGIRGTIDAGKKVKTQIDPKTRLPIYSLYGKTRKPTAQMLRGVDVLLIDLQDVGIRSYTFIYTMAKVMEAAAEYHKEVIVLDRPNPIGGVAVEGNLVQPGYFSFVGMYPIPYRHGMTIGELAKLFNHQYQIHSKLTVIPLVNWQRKMSWADTQLPWVPTSPHVPHWITPLLMGATGSIGELGVLSTGVGYTLPFEMIGATWINGERFAKVLNRLNLPGVIFRPAYFKPFYGIYKGKVCQGVQIHVTNVNTFKPFITGIHLMKTSMRLYPRHHLFRKSSRFNMFNKVMGSNHILVSLQRGYPVSQIEAAWQNQLNYFKKVRRKYLIY
ncbi:MAG: DUF1343 domain-containing protein [Thiomargarita sp.]|nr:DUF1343 domain-containing protein [Thiomargarita sp.]